MSVVPLDPAGFMVATGSILRPSRIGQAQVSDPPIQCQPLDPAPSQSHVFVRRWPYSYIEELNAFQAVLQRTTM